MNPGFAFLKNLSKEFALTLIFELQCSHLCDGSNAFILGFCAKYIFNEQIQQIFPFFSQPPPPAYLCFRTSLSGRNM